MTAGPVVKFSSAAAKIVMGVDDAPENLALLKAVVEAAGYTFRGAASGAECLSFLAYVRPALILLDVEMPDMSGLEVCRTIRSAAKPVAVPIIFLTAHREDEDVQECFAAGGDDFIVKPFDVIVLLDHIKRWVDRGDESRPAAGAKSRA